MTSTNIIILAIYYRKIYIISLKHEDLTDINRQIREDNQSIFIIGAKHHWQQMKADYTIINTVSVQK